MDGVTLRRATADDYDFMRALYGFARAEEMERFPLGEAEKVAFLDQQFAAQSEHYAKHYSTARFDIIEKDGQRVGRLYVDVWPSEIRIVDIALIPAFQKAGIGTFLVRRILDEARASGKGVSIHVEMYNTALRWYQRLGFRQVDTNGVYYLMRWSPETDQLNTAS
jgi:ribosomal protein S18 acetylase RimI-like enzyme